MSFSGRWFVPGPVEVHPEVLAAMARPVFHHRGDVAQALLQRMQPRLRALFRTARPVMMQTGSATALMEGAVRSGVRKRVLSVIGGTFGERFADIAERCGKEVVRLRVPTGATLEPELLGRVLDGPPVDAVTLVHAESSTGALAPLGELLPLFRRLDDIVVIADVVASLGATPVETGRWLPDFVLTGSQKALGLPPGLAFGVASERFLARAAEQEDRGRYLDIVALHEAAAGDRFPQTPAIPLIHALDLQLERIAAEGLPAREARHRTMREQVEAWVAADGRVALVAPPGRRADGVSALRLAPGRAAADVVRTLAARGWTITTGLDDEAGESLRIGHMGEVTPDQLAPLLAELSSIL